MAFALGPMEICIPCALYVSRGQIFREFGFHSSFLETNFRGLESNKDGERNKAGGDTVISPFTVLP